MGRYYFADNLSLSISLKMIHSLEFYNDVLRIAQPSTDIGFDEIKS